MAKIQRYEGNLQAFASAATGQERVIFGNDDSPPVQSDDLTTNINSNFARGWGVLPLGNKPPREWFNSVAFAATQLSAYQHQVGVPEWDDEQEYHEGSIANIEGDIFVSLAADNVGNDPLISGEWSLSVGSIKSTIQLTQSERNYSTGTSLLLSHYESDGDGYESQWQKTDATGTASQTPIQRGDGTLTDANGSVWRMVSGVANFPIKYSIPSDYATFQEAINATYNKIKMSDQLTVTLEVESGHALTAPLRLTDGDYGFYRLASVDTTVFLDPSFTPAVVNGASNGTGAMFSYKAAIMPEFDILVDAQDAGDTGIWLSTGSSGQVVSGRGVINAGEMGFWCGLRSSLVAHGANWSGSGSGCRVTTNSKLSGLGANYSGVKNATGFQGPTAGMDVTRCSTSYVDDSDISGCAYRGLSVRRATCSAENCNLSNAGENAVTVQRGMSVNLRNSDLSGYGGSALSLPGGGGWVNITGATTRTSAPGVPNAADTNASRFNISSKNGTVIDATIGGASDYQETGSFTPVIEGASNPGSHTYTAQDGNYTRFGDTLYFELRVSLSSFDGAASGALLITGLPIPPVENFISGCSISELKVAGLPAGFTQAFARVSNDAVAFRYMNTSGGNFDFDVSNLDSSSSIRLSGTYNVGAGAWQ